TRAGRAPRPGWLPVLPLDASRPAAAARPGRRSPRRVPARTGADTYRARAPLSRATHRRSHRRCRVAWTLASSRLGVCAGRQRRRPLRRDWTGPARSVSPAASVVTGMGPRRTSTASVSLSSGSSPPRKLTLACPHRRTSFVAETTTCLQRSASGRGRAHRRKIDMTTENRTELAHRASDGIEISLLWSKPANRLTIEVSDVRLHEWLEFEVDGSEALDAFYHPYAYAASRRSGRSTSGALAARQPSPLTKAANDRAGSRSTRVPQAWRKT